MPTERPTQELNAAKAAVNHAQGVRSYHRRKGNRGNQQREADIEVALDRLRTTMLPLRSMIGRFPYEPQTSVSQANQKAIRDASQAIQSERRKLHKMKARNP